MSNGWTIAAAAGGLALSTASLAWQAITWRLNRGRLRVSAGDHVMIGGGEQTDMTTVSASNRGGMAVEVSNIYLCGPRRGLARIPLVRRLPRLRKRDVTMLLFMPPVAVGPPLPHRLEAGSSAMWAVPRASVAKQLERAGIETVHPIITMGTGKQARGSRYRPKTGALTKR